MAKGLISEQCVETTKEPDKEILLLTRSGLLKSFRSLADWLNARGGSEAAVTARTRIGWIKFRECGELLYGREFS